MSNQLTEEELAALMPSEMLNTRHLFQPKIVSSDEFYPDPQNERQREVEARMLAMADDLGGSRGWIVADFSRLRLAWPQPLSP